MARKPRYTPLAVYMNGRRVGLLRREPSGAIDFAYEPTWLTAPSAIPVSLSLPLREDRYRGAPVVAVFDNLLPDNIEIRGRIAARTGAEGVDPYSLLATLGRDCVGALQFLPETAPAPAPGPIAGDVVSETEIARVLANLARAPLGLETDDDFRISIAGAQEKTAFLRQGEQWLRPRGSTPTTHIFKPQIGQLPNGLDLSNSVENEYLCLTLMSAWGLPSAKVEMARFEDRRVLVVERFDRVLVRDNRLLRRPQEDFCQALSTPWTGKYEADGGPGVLKGLDLLAASDAANLDRTTFLKAQVAFWVLGATDGHAKNFSVLLGPSGFRLAPLYDVLSAEPSRAARQIELKQMKLAMAVGDKRHYRIGDVAPRHFVQSGAAAGLDPNAVRRLLSHFAEEGPNAMDMVLSALPADFPETVSSPIAKAARSRFEQISRFVDTPSA